MAWAPPGQPTATLTDPLGPDRATDHPCGSTPEDQMVAPREHPPDVRGLWAARSTPPS
jgi:hypothetical protein